MSARDLFGPAVPGLPDALAHRADPIAHGLVPLPWFAFDVASSAGCRAAAARLARRAEHAYWLLRQTLDVSPPLRLAVLDRAAWRALPDAPPFGVMHVDGDGVLVVGAEPAGAWCGVSAWLAEHLDVQALARLTHVHGEDPRTRGPALGPLAEALIAHEIGHVFAHAAGARFPTRWLAEAFANYAMVAALGETDPAGLRRLGSLADAAETLDHHLPSLEQFEASFGRMGVIPSVLAQLALTRGVYQTYAAVHTAGLRRMLDLELHPTIAAIPQLFPAARLKAAA